MGHGGHDVVFSSLMPLNAPAFNIGKRDLDIFEALSSIQEFIIRTPSL
ncbi:hypothetical protein SNOG_01994 [Parastagonospora nodorum SN15]|uniref:Uncharacterized protein n=1 Tax=Phaeosphaeria nodorum (strain SN15 / ATCC MYA-4574 / FGSC 10173) TaxID=321614 RepID=Q0V1X0_PHANO|nr:hypothetical protein SNOG_01994 [Parastagonospora nodorum SN15]EAT90206.1 hypothetical protein SNOG_01994 [Parastagonospora nodorum SN15]